MLSRRSSYFSHSCEANEAWHKVAQIKSFMGKWKEILDSFYDYIVKVCRIHTGGEEIIVIAFEVSIYNIT